MNKELIKFIELCLADDVISAKEKKVIFRKAEELGVPKDECEIILDGLVLKNANKKIKPLKKPKQLTSKKENNKQKAIIDSRQPLKKEGVNEQKNPKKIKNTSPSEIKVPTVIRVMLALILGFGYCYIGIILVMATGPIIWGIMMVLAYFIYRFFKLQEDFFYFTFWIFIVSFGSNGDVYSIGANLPYIALAILLFYSLLYIGDIKKTK